MKGWEGGFCSQQERRRDLSFSSLTVLVNYYIATVFSCLFTASCSNTWLEL